MTSMKQAQEMQEQMARAQEEAKNEIGEASAGGGMLRWTTSAFFSSASATIVRNL